MSQVLLEEHIKWKGVAPQAGLKNFKILSVDEVYPSRSSAYNYLL